MTWMEWFEDVVMRLFVFALLGFNTVLYLRGASVVFKSFLLFLVIGELAGISMIIAQQETGNKDLAWEIRYIYGFFDTVYLLWLAAYTGNYRNRKKLSVILPSIAGGVWLFFLILHYTGVMEFKVGLLESSMGMVLSIALGFALLSRVEVPEEINPFLNPVNLLLTSQLIYVFSTITIFGIAGTEIRDRYYFIHQAVHILRDIVILAAMTLEYRRLNRTEFKA
ncbi:MAG TPA: hypothetical protein VJ911_00350 [Cryomorphaceae bacterium]|nr:hypothetical protein [Cryomorphaceae bacterium]